MDNMLIVNRYANIDVYEKYNKYNKEKYNTSEYVIYELYNEGNIIQKISKAAYPRDKPVYELQEGMLIGENLCKLCKEYINDDLTIERRLIKAAALLQDSIEVSSSKWAIITSIVNGERGGKDVWMLLKRQCERYIENITYWENNDFNNNKG